MLFERREKRREALLALRPAAIAVVDLHVRDHALRQPALDERVERLFLHPPAELQSSMLLTAGLPISSTMREASSSVLMSGVCSESGSMQ